MDTFLIEQLLRRLLHVPGAGAERHSGGPLLHAHVAELAEHLVKVRILKVDKNKFCHTIILEAYFVRRACKRGGPMLSGRFEDCEIFLVLPRYHSVLRVIGLRGGQQGLHRNKLHSGIIRGDQVTWILSRTVLKVMAAAHWS